MRVAEITKIVTGRLPLIYVFISGIGFSLQTLLIKLLSEGGFRESFQCVLIRGFVQFIMSSFFVYFDSSRRIGNGPHLFGDSKFVSLMLLLRSFVGFCGISFAYLSVELIPLGDTTTLCMLSPLFAAAGSFLFLGESFRIAELIATMLCLAGGGLRCATTDNIWAEGFQPIRKQLSCLRFIIGSAIWVLWWRIILICASAWHDCQDAVGQRVFLAVSRPVALGHSMHIYL